MGINDKLPGINRRADPTVEAEEFRDATLDSELLERLRLVYGFGTELTSPGIVAVANPALEDGTTLTAPLLVTLDPSNSARVRIRAGRVVFPDGHVFVLLSTVTKTLLSTAVGSQMVVYLEYANEETDLRPVRTRVTAVNTLVQRKTDDELLKVAFLADYLSFSVEQRKRVVALALVSIQASSSTASSTVVDLSRNVLADNRPWFSPVDVHHRSLVGSGSATDANPHGMTANDFMAIGDITFYEAAFGLPLVLAPDVSLPYVPGTLCNESLPLARWVADDESGTVTSVPGAPYVRLLGYPLALGACVLVDGTEDTPTNQLLPVVRVPKTNVLYASPDVYRKITIPGPGTDSLTLVTIESALVRLFTVQVQSSSSTESVAFTPATNTLLITYRIGTSTTDTLRDELATWVAGAGSAYCVSSSVVGTSLWPSGLTGSWTQIPANSVWRLTYTAARAVEPPADYQKADITVGSPASTEAWVANGLMVNTLASNVRGMSDFGTIPRRVLLLEDKAAGLLTIPQVLLPLAALSDAVDNKLAVAAEMYSAGIVRVWLKGAIPTASLQVQLKITGTDTAGAATSETLTFGAAWTDSVVPASVENPTQCQQSTQVFSAVTGVEILTQTNDGPFSEILVEAIPSLVAASKRALFVASFFWNGYAVTDLKDERAITRSMMHHALSSWVTFAESVVANMSITRNPADAPVNVLTGDDATSMLHSDLVNTRRFAGSLTTRLADPEIASVAGTDAYYYTNAMQVPAGNRWFELVLLGDVEVAYTAEDATIPLVEYRYADGTTPGDEAEWSAWVACTPNPVVRSSSGSTCAFIASFSEGTVLTGVQFRFCAAWLSYYVLSCTDPAYLTQGSTFPGTVHAADFAFLLPKTRRFQVPIENLGYWIEHSPTSSDGANPDTDGFISMIGDLFRVSFDAPLPEGVRVLGVEIVYAGQGTDLVDLHALMSVGSVGSNVWVSYTTSNVAASGTEGVHKVTLPFTSGGFVAPDGVFIGTILNNAAPHAGNEMLIMRVAVLIQDDSFSNLLDIR